jgi:hypothetical protein
MTTCSRTPQDTPGQSEVDAAIASTPLPRRPAGKLDAAYEKAVAKVPPSPQGTLKVRRGATDRWAR